jgi:putative Ca2+/H+ antiporter (TMEM165/GDT1 family)
MRFRHKPVTVVAGAVTSAAALVLASGGVAPAGAITQSGNSSVIAAGAADHSLWAYWQPIGASAGTSEPNPPCEATASPRRH